MKRWVATLATAATAAIFLPGPAVAAPDPESCTGYPEPRVFLDSQSWWITPEGQTGNDFGHTHAATCFPLQQTVTGTVRLDVKITMHENPGWLGSLTVQGVNGSNYVMAQRKFTQGDGYTCPAGTCSWWFGLNVDTTKVPTSGRTEWRIRPKVNEPDGKNMTGSTSYQTVHANGGTVKSYRPINFLQGKGWYTDIEYSQARLVDDQFPSNMPTSGTWEFGTICDSTGLPLTDCLVTVDPNFHADDEGQVLHHSTSGDDSQVAHRLNLDTLAPGPHKLVIRAGTAAPRDGSTQFGILAVPFAVGR